MRGIKSKINFILDEKDNRGVRIFIDIGLPKNLAKTILYLS
jgi:hypothetical protein